MKMKHVAVVLLQTHLATLTAVFSLTCTLQMSHHPPSWAGSQGLDGLPLSLLL